MEEHFSTPEFNEFKYNLCQLINSDQCINKSFIEKKIAQNLDDFISNADDYLSCVPFNSLYNIFNHPERKLNDHDKAYHFIINNGLKNQNIYVILGSLNGQLFKDNRNKINSFINRNDHFGFCPKNIENFFSEIDEHYNVAKKQILDFNNQLNDVKKQNSDLNNQLNKAKKQISDLNNQLINAKKQNSDLNNQLINVKQQNSDLNNQLINTKKQFSDLNNQLIGLNQQKEEFVSTIKKLRQNVRYFNTLAKIYKPGAVYDGNDYLPAIYEVTYCHAKYKAVEMAEKILESFERIGNSV